MDSAVLFWLLAALLTAFALLLVLPPLLGLRRRRETPDADEANVRVYRARLAELEEANGLGMLGDEELARARDELARELLASTAGAPTAPERTARRATTRSLAAAVALAVPLLAMGLYLSLGDDRALEPRTRDEGPAATAPAAAPETSQELEQMVARLVERLADEPDNGQGWLLLARSYMVLERYARATEAFAKAHALVGDDPSLLVDYAEAEALVGNRDFLGAPSDRIEMALRLAPQHPKGLWLGGFAALQRGETELAVSRWRALLARHAQDSDAARVLRGLIARAEPESREASPGETGPTRATLRVVVRLDESLAGTLRGDETVFVFARAPDGPKMPLAVARTRVSDLPATVELDDSMSMVPGMKLSSFETVIVGARVSFSGGPTASSGDLQGFSEPVAVQRTDAVDVSIAHEVP